LQPFTSLAHLSSAFLSLGWAWKLPIDCETQTMPEFNIATLAKNVANAIPDREYIIHGNTRLSFREMQERSRRFGRYLIDQGFEVTKERDNLGNHEIGQETVGLYLHNGTEFLVSTLGCFEARVAPFNINYRYVATELSYLLQDSHARGLVYHSAFAKTLTQLFESNVKPQTLIQVPDKSNNPLLPGAIWFEDAIAKSEPKTDVEPKPDDAYILYTGGTTGLPKGVLWRQADVYVAALGGRNRHTNEEWGNVANIVEVAQKGSKNRVMPLPPFMHGAGLWPSLTGLLSGNTIIIPKIVDHFSVNSILEAAERERATTLVIVGEAFARPLCEAIETDRYDLTSITAFVNSGAALHTATKTRLLQLLPDLTIIDTLGSSETGTQAQAITTSTNSEESGFFTTTHTGSVIDSTRSRFAIPGEKDLGWLVQRGRLPLGYLNDAQKTASTFPTIAGERMGIAGDRAQLRLDGKIILYGRDSVTINSGGEKIFAEEVEQALMHHPAVVDAIVCGRPSERWGTEVCAVLACYPGLQPSETEILAEAGRHIAHYKLPKVIIHREKIYRSPSGKADYLWASSQVNQI